MAVFVVPGALVPGLLLEAKEAGVKGAVVISGGFGEVGNTDLERALVSNAKSCGIRLVGPNCQGINYTGNRLCATWPLVTEKGPVAVISQSGTVGAALASWAEDEGLGVSGIVSLGNKSDVSELELLEFFGHDPDTKAIAMYLERVKSGPEFLKIAKRVAPNKALVALKGGRTAHGRRAAESHTRSIAGKYEVFEAVCRDLGIKAARDVEELYDFAKAGALLPKPRGKKLMIITSSGGSGILATDTVTDCGLEMATVTPEIKRELGSILPDYCVISNPLDLTGDATAERYSAAAAVLAKHGAADIYLFVFGDPIPGVLEAVKTTSERTGCPVASIYIGGGKVQIPEVKSLHRAGLAVYPTPERAVKAIGSVC